MPLRIIRACRAVLAAVFVTLAGQATATDYYFCSCDAGSEGGCSAGADGNNGLTPGTAKQTWNAARNLFNSTATCGDVIHLCRGGAFDFDGSDIPLQKDDLNCVSNPIVIRMYEPGAFTQRPKIVGGGGDDRAIAFGLSSSCTTGEIRGARVEDLQFVGNGASGKAIYLNCTGTDVILDDIIIDGWGGCGQVDGTNVVRLTMQSTQCLNSSSTGWLGGPGNGFIADSNYFYNNGHGCTSDCGFTHSWYIGLQQTTTGAQITNNTVERSCVNATTQACSCNGWAIRGGDGLIFRGNTVLEIDPGGGTGRSNPCSVRFNLNGGSTEADGIQNATVSRNTFVGVDFVEFCGAQNSVFENNQYFYPTQASIPAGTTPIAFVANDRINCGGGGPDLTATGIIVRNNSAYIDATGLNEVQAYQFRITEGTGYQATGNVVHIVGGPGNSSGMDYQISGSLISADYNVVYRAGTGSGHYGRCGGSAGTLASVQTCLGGCAGAGNECGAVGVSSDPLFTDVTHPGSLAPSSGASPVVDIGPAADAALFSTTDFDGTARPINTDYDAGAFEFGTPASSPGIQGSGSFSISEARELECLRGARGTARGALSAASCAERAD